MFTVGGRQNQEGFQVVEPREGLGIQYAGKRQQDGAFGILIGAVVGRLFLVPRRAAHYVLPGSYGNVNDLTPVADLHWYTGQWGDVAAFAIGSKYPAGEGVPEDDRNAVRWVRLPAKQGLAEGQVNLGMLYTRGYLGPEDLVLAYLWQDLSAAEGVEIALRNKEIIERVMTREQIAKATRLGREWTHSRHRRD